MVPIWSEQWIPLLSIAQTKIPRVLPRSKNRNLLGGKLKLLARRLYHKGNDGILWLCIEPLEQEYFLKQAHQSSIGIHLASQQMAQALM